MWIQNGRGRKVGICSSTLFLVYGGIHWDDSAYHLVFVLFGSQLCSHFFPTSKRPQICQLHVSCLGYSPAHKKHHCSGQPRTPETSMRLPWTNLSWLTAQIYLLFSCLVGLGTSGVFPPPGNEAQVLSVLGFPNLSGDSTTQHQPIPFFLWLYSEEHSQ